MLCVLYVYVSTLSEILYGEKFLAQSFSQIALQLQFHKDEFILSGPLKFLDDSL